MPWTLRARATAKVLVEAAVIGREIDIGVLERTGGDLEVSPPLEILTSSEHNFFDYRAKYNDADTVLDVPATLDPAITEALAQDALLLFRALDCSGLLRVDFFVRADGRTVLNEVDTFPGFSSASQYPGCGRPPDWDTATCSTSWATRHGLVRYTPRAGRRPPRGLVAMAAYGLLGYSNGRSRATGSG